MDRRPVEVSPQILWKEKSRVVLVPTLTRRSEDCCFGTVIECSILPDGMVASRPLVTGAAPVDRGMCDVGQIAASYLATKSIELIGLCVDSTPLRLDFKSQSYSLHINLPTRGQNRVSRAIVY